MEINNTNAMYLWENEEIRNQYKEELSSIFQKIISENRSFSREYLYREVRSHAIGISFYPTSLSYEKHGQQIVVEALKDENLESNLLNNINTYGTIIVVPLHSSDNEQYEIDTNDIYEIASYK